MAKCCLCDKEGVYLAHGKWWCAEHYDLASEPLKDLFQKDGTQNHATNPHRRP